jgi:membrane-associated protease RseP (regulator of RpoE activity)
LIAVFTVLVAGTSLIRTVRSFYRLDFPVTWNERGLQVGGVPPGSSASAAQLSAGDLILEIDSISIDRLEDPVFVLAAGKEHRLTVTGASGESRAVMFAPPAAVIDPIYLARSAVGLFGLGCALVALWLTDRREAATFLRSSIEWRVPRCRS